MSDVQTIIDGVLFRFQELGWLDLLDLLLVTAAIYVLLQVIRRSQAAFVLRAVVVLAGLLLLANLLLPLPTFGIFLTVAALAVIITLPIVLQPELRRWLERFGRRVGFSFSGSESVSGQVVPEITAAVENMSDSKTGALIVLEGAVPLTEVIASGVRLGGRVTAELLQTIFFDKTPLHDGAAIVRDDRIVAAGCVLPLSERELLGWRRLGTRHRAAVGISEVSDALAIVVSEETGAVSVAEDGRLRQDIDRGELTQALRDFYSRGPSDAEGGGWRPWRNWHLPSLREFLIDFLYLVLSFILALMATTAVRISSDPFVQGRQEAVPLQVEGLPADTTLTVTLPRTVAVDYEAPQSELPSIGVTSFQAVISLTQVTEGVTRVPVNVTTTANRVNVIGAVPAEIDVGIATITSKELPISVEIEDADTISAAYQISGEAMTEPETAVVSGPQPAVDQVVAIGTTISVENATASVRQSRALLPLDADGARVADVTVEPANADVSVVVRRRVNARDVGVRAVTSGSPPDGYWLSGLTVDPSSVTVQGNTNTIAEMGSFIDTAPIDLSEAVGELVVDAPLVLPNDVQALDSSGDPLTTVTVTALVAARSGDLLTERPVELINDRGEFAITLDPPTLELLLSGPLPTLNEIEAQPDLVRVIIDAGALIPGQSVEISPEIIAPDDIRVQLVDTAVLVTTEAPPQ